MKSHRKAGDPETKAIEVKVHKKDFSAAELKTLCPAAGLVYQDGDEANVIQFIASTPNADREGDVMVMEGADFKDYQTNPVFMWVHDLGDKPPLGAVIEIKIVAGADGQSNLLMTVLFQQVQQFAREVCELYRLGYLKAVSIGFRSKRNGLKFPTDQEREALNMRPGGVIFTAWELYELSGCPVGMNAEALSVRSWGKKTIALLKGEDPSNISDNEDINMKPEEITKAIKDGITAGLPDFLKGIDFTLLTLKTGEPVTGAHIQAMHNAHAAFSKALTHMAAAVQEHPIVPDDAGARGPMMSDKCSKSLNNAITQGTKAIIHARSVAAAHADEENDGDEDDQASKTEENKAIAALAKSRPGVYGEEEKTPLQALAERFTR